MPYSVTTDRFAERRRRNHEFATTRFMAYARNHRDEVQVMAKHFVYDDVLAELNASIPSATEPVLDPAATPLARPVAVAAAVTHTGPAPASPSLTDVAAIASAAVRKRADVRAASLASRTRSHAAASASLSPNRSTLSRGR